MPKLKPGSDTLVNREGSALGKVREGRRRKGIANEITFGQDLQTL